jgi:hypothetical protein
VGVVVEAVAVRLPVAVTVTVLVAVALAVAVRLEVEVGEGEPVPAGVALPPGIRPPSAVASEKAPRMIPSETTPTRMADNSGRLLPSFMA